MDKPGQTRELRTLYRVAELLERCELGPGQLFRAVAAVLPSGFPRSGLTRARVTFRDRFHDSPGFEAAPHVLRAPITVCGRLEGSLEVVYLGSLEADEESPFTLDQRKLVEMTAQKLAQWVEERECPREGEDVAPPQPDPRPDWQVLLDVMAEIDATLHKRMLRRLMNHLTKLGVPGVLEMIVQLDPAIYAQREADSQGYNVPLPKRDMLDLERAFQETLRVATLALGDAELNARIREWMRQDKLGFLALATEKRDISLVEITDLVDRFCRETREDEPALSPSDDLNVRVALTRRFLTDNLKVIHVAKRHMSVYDFGRLLKRVAGPAQGNGKVGGKAAGLILADHILRSHAAGNPLLEDIRTPPAWYITSDGIYNFLRHNSLDDLWSLKFDSVDEIRHTFPYLEQVFKHSHFSLEMYNQLSFALDELGEGPLIVRSSSLLEDSEGSAFSGKYRSLFLANTGDREKRLEALLDAVAEVYASVFSPDPIQYRAERGLLDFMEEMGIIIQRVVGTKVGRWFFPAFAGVAFSNNEFRWSPRLRREDGIVRMVAGLGTRAVDRVGDDFPVLVSPGQPDLRVNVTPEQVMRYAQTRIDAINLESGRFETTDLADIFREAGEELPMLEKIVSVLRHGTLMLPIRGMLDPAREELVVTFRGLLESTTFVPQVREVLRVLQETLGTPVDVEFAHDGSHLYLLQCRPQSRLGEEGPVTVPHRVPFEHKLFSANKYVTNGRIAGIRHLVYVDPDAYAKLPTRADMVSVADAVSRLNALLPRRSFILMGPGRWGSRGDITLGVGVSYSGISNSALLVEIARRKGSYVPDLSFGTHFFQDLVEAGIRYLALYPDEEGNLFNEAFFTRSPNALGALLPDCAHLDAVLRVLDVEALHPGCRVEVLMDGEQDRALAFIEACVEGPPSAGSN